MLLVRGGMHCIDNGGLLNGSSKDRENETDFTHSSDCTILGLHHGSEVLY